MEVEVENTYTICGSSRIVKLAKSLVWICDIHEQLRITLKYEKKLTDKRIVYKL